MALLYKHFINCFNCSLYSPKYCTKRITMVTYLDLSLKEFPIKFTKHIIKTFTYNPHSFPLLSFSILRRKITLRCSFLMLCELLESLKSTLNKHGQGNFRMLFFFFFLEDVLQSRYWQSIEKCFWKDQ